MNGKIVEIGKGENGQQKIQTNHIFKRSVYTGNSFKISWHEKIDLNSFKLTSDDGSIMLMKG